MKESFRYLQVPSIFLAEFKCSVVAQPKKVIFIKDFVFLPVEDPHFLWDDILSAPPNFFVLQVKL